MLKNKIIIATLLFLGQALSGQTTGLNMEIKSRKVLQDVPSASGIIKVGKDYLVTGDNSPWLFELNGGFRVKDRFLIFPAGKKFDIIPKEMKPDFEALAYDRKDRFVYVFGSGSRSPQRDVVVRFTMDGKEPVADVFSVRELYQKIRNKLDLKPGELNIEGAVITGDMLFLLDRENNYVLAYKWNEVRKYFGDFRLCPLPEVYKLRLPEINGVEAGFSGATAAFDGNKILFTASVEKTDDTYHDGEILGSFVGIFNIMGLKDGKEPVCVCVKQDGKLLKIKIESVCLQKEAKGNSAEVVLVTDSDGGVSEVLKAELNLLFK